MKALHKNINNSDDNSDDNSNDSSSSSVGDNGNIWWTRLYLAIFPPAVLRPVRVVPLQPAHDGDLVHLSKLDAQPPPVENHGVRFFRCRGDCHRCKRSRITHGKAREGSTKRKGTLEGRGLHV